MKNIHNLIIEGPDGVGKTTLIKNIFKHYNYMYMCYHRGEISNYIYAKKYNRPYYVTQNGLPFLYIVLLADKNSLENRIWKRASKENWKLINISEELDKADDSKLFEEVAKQMSSQYDIEIIDTTNLTEEQVLDRVVEILDKRYEEATSDETLSEWNKMYKKGCEVLGKEFKVINNQPYIDKKPANCETTLHNGAYETFTNKTVPNNLIFTLGYGKTKVSPEVKSFDFQYIINSKIKNRPEVIDYYNAFEKAGLGCITSNYETIREYNNFKRYDRIFGEQYLEIISQAKATVYTAREVEYLKIQTGRLYEGIIAQNVVFVDKDSDKNQDMLKNIYGKDSDLIELLTVTPENIVERYKTVFSDSELVKKILQKQNDYLSHLMEIV